MSGACAAQVEIEPDWKGWQLRRAIAKQQSEDSLVQIIYNGAVLQDGLELKDAGLGDGGEVMVAIINAPPDFREAAWQGQEGICMAMLRNPDFATYMPGLNFVDEGGFSVLHHAANRGLTRVCLEVLGRPDFERVNHRNLDGETALHFALYRGNQEVASAIKRHPDFKEEEAINNFGETAEQLGKRVFRGTSCGTRREELFFLGYRIG